MAKNEVMAHIEKYKATVKFKDGSVRESPWFYSDIHARQFAEQHFDDVNYEGYSLDTQTFKEDIASLPTSPNHPVFG